ncbi:hypothetical protein [Paractinoplanes maris]|uniref:hypothetical protein n=1 Tax=Paractinoplanes maris TaxID=1734446 RepID=UPI00201FF6D6|nr:hypothetical protein [Actinoplanes maris]
MAERRLGELRSDLHDHITDDQARGTADWRIALSVMSRMARGLPADAVWRSRIRPWTGDVLKSFAAILAAGLALAAVGVLAILYGSGDDSPGLVLIGILLIIGAFIIGVRTGHRRGRSVDHRRNTRHP